MNIFKKMTLAQAIALELAEAEHALLRSQTGVEYAQAMVAYNEARVDRLREYQKAAATS